MKTFKDCYKEVSTMSPKKMWIQRIAKVTHRSEATVRMWLSGRQVPEVLIQEIIAKELGVPVEGLFPKIDAQELYEQEFIAVMENEIINQ